MTTTSERIAAAIKHILDEDRRADRERIAELERDLNTIRGDAGLVNDALGILDLVQAPEAIDKLNKQLDDLTEKCAALVVERDQLRWQMVTGERDKAPTLRIDTDMVRPFPGKLLVVRIDDADASNLLNQDRFNFEFHRDQFVGFLVETPAVEVKEQGPWVVTRQTSSSVTGWNYYNDPKEPDWAERAHNATRFEDASIAEAVAVQTNDRFGSGWFVRTLAEARAIEAKR